MAATARKLFTGREVDRMVDAGILREGDHVELLGGTLYFSTTGDRRRFSSREAARLVRLGIVRSRRLEVRTHPDAKRGRYRARVMLAASDDVGLPSSGVRFTVASMLP